LILLVDACKIERPVTSLEK